MERFKSITKSYYKNSHCIVLVFDLTNVQSFKNLANWMDSINKHREEYKSEPYPHTTIAGMKSDIATERNVNIEIINQFCADNDITYFEASAKNGNGINEMFNNVCIKLLVMPNVIKIEQKTEITNPKKFFKCLSC